MMRLSGFLVGGIVGLCTAAYITKNRPGALAWAGNLTGDLVSGVKGRLLEQTLNRKFGAEQSAGSQQQTANASTAASMSTNVAAASASQSDKQLIQNLINSDPEVKAEADKIKVESAIPASALR